MTGELIETIFAAFDGHASDVNAATVRDMMIANAEAGYWNGARQPFGYETRTVVVLRKKEKKKLFIVEDEAAVIRLVYKLYLEGHATSALLGIKAICTFLNTRGYTMRGKPFYTTAIENILKSETYAGTAYFDCRDSRTKLPRHWKNGSRFPFHRSSRPRCSLPCSGGSRAASKPDGTAGG